MLLLHGLFRKMFWGLCINLQLAAYPMPPFWALNSPAGLQCKCSADRPLGFKYDLRPSEYNKAVFQALSHSEMGLYVDQCLHMRHC